jgi:peptidoglycan/xylan/chitin deacetylase (PgdA/CDA1 family)
VWTPKILDVLKREHATATFFLIGREAETYNSLTERVYREGHEIGNHTYTHPVLDEISPTQLRWELNLTQRLIESTLGVKSILFRPPYGIVTSAGIRGRSSATTGGQDMGYLIVGQRSIRTTGSSHAASKYRRNH